jgi:hypothetical protein
VYSTVVVVVVAAPRNSALVNVAISYYLSFRGHPLVGALVRQLNFLVHLQQIG